MQRGHQQQSIDLTRLPKSSPGVSASHTGCRSLQQPGCREQRRSL